MTTSLAGLRARLPELTQRDQLRLSRRADRAAALGDAAARERAFGQILAELDRAAARVASAAPVRAGDLLSARAADQPEEGRDRGGHPRPPGRHRRRRDRLREDDPAAEDLPRARPRCHRPDRAHPASPDRCPDRGRADRRGTGHRTRHDRRLQGAVQRQLQRRDAGQADDRRHPADRDAAGPASAALRHADHRRGARAQPQHRLHPGLPEAPAAEPPRPQGHHHLRHHRPPALQ